MPRIPDRIRLFAAVASTAALPTTARVAARRALLTRLQAQRTRRADIVVICHPKSGSTWFRVMLSRLYHMKYGLPPERIVKSDEFNNRNPDLPVFLFTNGHYAYESATRSVLEETQQGPAEQRKKVILLARNPCDLAVSWHIQFTKRTKAYKREQINHWLHNPIDPATIERWDFAMHEEMGLPGLIEFHNDWAQRVLDRYGGAVVRYEDLRAEPVEALRRVVSFLEAPFSDEEIRHAVEFASFDNLRQLEISGFFKNSGMKLRNPNDADTLKVRRGKVGGFRDYFTEEQVAQMEQMMSERMTLSLGYSAAAQRSSNAT